MNDVFSFNFLSYIIFFIPLSLLLIDVCVVLNVQKNIYRNAKKKGGRVKE